MLRPGFVSPPQVREPWDLTRHPADLMTARTAEKQQAEKLLEDACIKLSAAVADIVGVQRRGTARGAGGRRWDQKVLAQLA